INTNGNINITPNGSGRVVIGAIDVNGGNIDGTVIGASTPAALTATRMTATDIFETRGIIDNATARKVTIGNALTS
ncbi:hypothetical protein SB690_20900, partial [Bacillus sp. SIMBA_006]